MIKFIHTADIHYGMENYGKIDPKTGIHTRLLDFDRAFNACIDRALKEEVDFFIFSGDAYKTANPSPTQQRLLFKALLRLQQANIPVVLIVGNHDNPLTFGKAHALEILGDIPLSGFHVIAKPTTLKLQTKNGPVNIVGIPWPTRNTIALNKNLAHVSAHKLTDYISEAVSTIIRQLADELDPTIPAVLGGHLTVANGIFSGSEKRAIYGTDPVFLPSQLAIAPFDYVALGHLHRHQDLNKNSSPPVVYAGSIERIDFGERKEPKGFCLVSIAEKGKASYEFCPVPVRPFIQIEVHLNAQENQSEKIISEIKKHNITNAVIKILYYIPPECSDTVDIAAVQKACAPAIYVAGIVPVKSLIARERRSSLSVQMSMQTLLEKYFATKPEIEHQREALIQKTLKFVEQAEAQESINES